MKIIEHFLNIISWLAIMISPLIFGILVGGLVYLFKSDKTGMTIGIIIAGISLIYGIIIATQIWKTRGTLNFIARIRATPDLDENPEENLAIKNKLE